METRSRGNEKPQPERSKDLRFQKEVGWLGKQRAHVRALGCANTEVRPLHSSLGCCTEPLQWA